MSSRMIVRGGGATLAAIVFTAVAAAGGCGADVQIDPDETDNGEGGEGGSGGSEPLPYDVPEEPNDRCASPRAIDLADGEETIVADTSTATDEFASLTCDSPNVAWSFDRGQLYYLLEMDPSRTYQFSLSSSFYGFVYVFPDDIACSADAIEAACSSDGESGMVSGIVNPGSTGVSSFRPVTAGGYIVVVDSDTSEGPFELQITVE